MEAEGRVLMVLERRVVALMVLERTVEALLELEKRVEAAVLEVVLAASAQRH